ncbi:hypothetical protein BG005_007158 [Podila minutissima]|nr:hypothetical protein BG005_007158 [Podila minutissima]
MSYCPYGNCYDDRLQNILIAGIVVLGIAVVAGIILCIHASKARRHKVAASASSSAERGLPMMVVQGTGTGPDGQPYQQQIQVQGPFFMTSQRGTNGEELVMVPRRLLVQFQQQQQQQQQQEQQQEQQQLQRQLQQLLQQQQQQQQQRQQQNQQHQYQLPSVVPPNNTAHLPQGLQRGDKAQMEDQQDQEQHQQPQPNLNANSQATAPAMSQRKFEKSVKVEHEDDNGGAGVGTSSDVVVVHQVPSSSGSESKSDENKGDKAST